MGLVPIDENIKAWLYYPQQKREYKLFHIDNIRKPKPQKNKGISLTITDRTIEDILKKRKK